MEQPDLKESCKKGVMSRIECGEVCPRSKTFFATRECAVWALWAVSVVVGALAVAVTFFVFTHRQYALYEATHDTFFTFMVDVLPLLWIVVFGVMVLVAVYNLRHTKKGYKYPLWQIFGSSMVLSLAGGAALHLFGLGYSTDHMLGERMNMYNSQEKLEQKMWQNPEEGRLLGRFEGPLPPPSTMMMFKDVSGEQWQVNVNELSLGEQELIERQENVRLLGRISDEDIKIFYSCGAFPWMLDKPMKREDLRAAREAFSMKVSGFREKAEHMALKVEGREDEDRENESPCSEMEPVRRMGQ
jgi:hypothetical protein